MSEVKVSPVKVVVQLVFDELQQKYRINLLIEGGDHALMDAEMAARLADDLKKTTMELELLEANRRAGKL